MNSAQTHAEAEQEIINLIAVLDDETRQRLTTRNPQADRDPFKRMSPEARAAIQAAVDQVYAHACAMLTAFMLQPDEEEPAPMIVDDHRDRCGYPADWDQEVPQPRKRPDPAGMVEAMLRDTACSSDEMDAGLFEGMQIDGN